jgi:hypothetical protein
MAVLVTAIHALLPEKETWMRGSSPRMTKKKESAIEHEQRLP